MAKFARVSSLQDFKNSGAKFACLTAYDQQVASAFDDAGIDVLLVGDSAADNSLGFQTTLPISLDEMIPFGRAVAGAAKHALVVVDLPFGSYEISNEQALSSAIRVMKETGAAAVKLEGGVRSRDRIRTLVEAGIPVMAHIGFTPQSVHALGGFKVQGRGDSADDLVADALAVQEAGAFAVVLELVPAELATALTKQLLIPTIGIGAGSGTDGQILVWTDFAGLSPMKPRKFVRRYLDLREQLTQAASQYAADVRAGNFPTADESFED